MNIISLHNAIEAVCPIHGVSIGKDDDRLSWRIDFSATATDAQKIAAEQILEAFSTNAATASDVRAEASRRLKLMFKARDSEHLNMIIANATREAVRLQNIRLSGQEWTPEQATRAAQLVAADAMVEAIRAASNVMEPNPPQDYADDKHWPK